MPSKKSEGPHTRSYLEQLAKRIRKRFDISDEFSNRLLGLLLVGIVALLLLICTTAPPPDMGMSARVALYVPVPR